MSKIRTNKNKQAAKSPWSAALRLLARRDYSTADLRQRLSNCGHPAEQVDSTIKKCLELGYLDDTRYALNRAQSLISQGRAVGHRVVTELRRHGIDDPLARIALTEAMENVDEEKLLAQLLDRRFPDFDFSAASKTEQRRVVHFLQRRGFNLDRILTYLTQKGP